MWEQQAKKATLHYKGVQQFYHNPYHSTKINIVNKLRTISRKLEVFLDEKTCSDIDLGVSLYPSQKKTSPNNKKYYLKSR